MHSNVKFAFTGLHHKLQHPSAADEDEEGEAARDEAEALTTKRFFSDDKYLNNLFSDIE